MQTLGGCVNSSSCETGRKSIKVFEMQCARPGRQHLENTPKMELQLHGLKRELWYAMAERSKQHGKPSFHSFHFCRNCAKASCQRLYNFCWLKDVQLAASVSLLRQLPSVSGIWFPHLSDTHRLPWHHGIFSSHLWDQHGLSSARIMAELQRGSRWWGYDRWNGNHIMRESKQADGYTIVVSKQA